MADSGKIQANLKMHPEERQFIRGIADIDGIRANAVVLSAVTEIHLLRLATDKRYADAVRNRAYLEDLFHSHMVVHRLAGFQYKLCSKVHLPGF